ncbi:HAD family hydrolase [Luteipulveratus sp. YIM 133132]|uniref:HAD family hydrolase n=1 Tax=Luteipulveratus flavus TaxID=3031728 RepID=A0ABT6C489_9MICO|nr:MULTISPECIES: HAD family hydrolase [unclassified Luteipulveratus]MDE9367831.1 HAD family hydrolase [Luteipulveratus sp. YIM 133132]MDF8263759.1 HAD family hydrolase [Luteipulveratus sp. YIM 133296]
MSRAYDAVLLDVDDTLLDTSRAMIAAGAVALRELWPGRDDGWYQAASERFRVDPGGHFRRYTEGELDFEEMRAARLREVAAAYGLGYPDAGHDRFEAAFRPAFRAAQRVYDDVRPFLARCAAAEVAVGAVTNSSAAATADKLDAVGLAEDFAVVVTRDTLGFGKPDARVFAHACGSLSVPPERTVFVGDELAADVRGAADAGLRACWLRRPAAVVSAHAPDLTQASSTAPEGTLIVSDLNAIPGTGDPFRSGSADGAESRFGTGGTGR